MLYIKKLKIKPGNLHLKKIKSRWNGLSKINSLAKHRQLAMKCPVFSSHVAKVRPKLTTIISSEGMSLALSVYTITRQFNVGWGDGSGGGGYAHKVNYPWTELSIIITAESQRWLSFSSDLRRSIQ